MNAIPNLARTYRPAPNTSAARRQVDWTQLSNANLKFALDTLELHHSPWVNDVLGEIQQRAAAGTWLDIDNPPPPLENMPKWLKMWPFVLLWHQRPR